MNYKHLKQWGTVSNYVGEEPVDYYIVYSQNRDSSLLDQSNFDYIWRKLEKYNQVAHGKPPRARILRASHWAVGWIDFILVHRDSEDACLIADDLLVDYIYYNPILDEYDYYERESDYKREYWRSIGIGDRIDLCKQAGISIFAARRDEMPYDVEEYIIIE